MLETVVSPRDRHGIRVGSTVLGCLLTWGIQAVSVSAQPVEEGRPSVQAYAQLNYLPVYGGDATVGSLSTWGVTGRLSFQVQQNLRVEGIFTHAPQDRDPSHRVPRIHYYGVAVQLSLLSPSTEADLFFLGGFSFMNVAVEEIECRAEDGCFNEGGPGYSDGTEATGIAGMGMSVPMGRSVALLLDGRWHLPRAFSEAGFVAGAGIGIQW